MVILFCISSCLLCAPTTQLHAPSKSITIATTKLLHFQQHNLFLRYSKIVREIMILCEYWSIISHSKFPSSCPKLSFNSIHFYCSLLNKFFKIEKWMLFIMDIITGTAEIQWQCVCFFGLDGYGYDGNDAESLWN